MSLWKNMKTIRREEFYLHGYHEIHDTKILRNKSFYSPPSPNIQRLIYKESLLKLFFFIKFNIFAMLCLMDCFFQCKT